DVGAGAIFEAARILNAFYAEIRGEQYLTFNPGVILGGTEVTYDDAAAAGTAFGKTNVVAERVVVKGDIRTITDEQLQRTREKMRQIVARSLPGTQATITFSDGYPSMPPTEGNQALLAMLDQVSRDLGHGPILPLDRKSTRLNSSHVKISYAVFCLKKKKKKNEKQDAT